MFLLVLLSMTLRAFGALGALRALLARTIWLTIPGVTTTD
jgi:hypothetical protein